MYVAFESETFDDKRKKWVMRVRSKDGTYQIVESPVRDALINYRNDFFEMVRERQRVKQ